MLPKHDIHDFLVNAQNAIQQEYDRILMRVKEDPGTAGDQGEENWATLLKNWLPGYFHIVTKGRILCENGYASPQVDVLVLYPSYPKILLDKKLYLAGGVAAAFECKLTLRSEHITAAVKTAVEIRKNLPKREGTPYKELNSPLLYGLLSHSHMWKEKKSQPLDNIEKTLWDADKLYVEHPNQTIDFLTVSDLATWQTMKMTFFSPKTPGYRDAFANIYGENGSASSVYMCASIGGDRQQNYFSPISVLLAGLFSKLGWLFNDMRGLEEYFRKVNMMGSGKGKPRLWPITIYSKAIRERIYDGCLTNGISYDEWHCVF